jgi:hypothetical protein
VRAALPAGAFAAEYTRGGALELEEALALATRHVASGTRTTLPMTPPDSA